MKNIFLFSAIIISFIISACQNQAKVIVADQTNNESGMSPSELSGSNQQAEAGSNEFHQIVAMEILNTDRYTYIHSTEGKDSFWVAVPRQEIQKGALYYFRGGLKKNNFYSQEFDRNFDLVYLVSQIVNAQEHPGNNNSQVAEPDKTIPVKSIEKPKDAIALNELLKSMKKYENQIIKVSGEVVKANYQIMGKNWYHIQDGTKHQGKSSDLTITSQSNARTGERVIFEGKIFLKKDFGAGYKYEIIMEEARRMEE